MDFPEGARVLNVSIDLGVRGRDAGPRPPVEAYLRVIDEPVLRLVSVDLGAAADITSLAEVFDFAKDYLGLLKAAVIAAGHRAAGHGRLRTEPGRPAGAAGRARAAARARQQRQRHPQGLAAGRLHQPAGVPDRRSACAPPARRTSLTGPLAEHERRLVAARAILGEWLGGSGGGWQDSGGVWPGMKLIEGVPAAEGDPGVRHQPRPAAARPPHPRPERGAARDAAAAAGQPGAGPRRHGAERRPDPGDGHREVPAALRGRMAGPAGGVSASSTRSWRRCAAGDVPRDRRRHHAQLRRARSRPSSPGPATSTPRRSSSACARSSATASGASGCWAACRAAAWASSSTRARKPQAQDAPAEHHERRPSAQLRDGAAVRHGAGGLRLRHQRARHVGRLLLDSGDARALMPPGYYALIVPELLRRDRRQLPRRAPRRDWTASAPACRTGPSWRGMVQTLFDRLLPRAGRSDGAGAEPAKRCSTEYGFDRVQHEQIRADLRSRPHRPGAEPPAGQQRHPRMCEPGDVMRLPPSRLPRRSRSARWAWTRWRPARWPWSRWPAASAAAGRRARAWSRRCIPSASWAARHRTFIEVHLAKSRRIGAAGRRAACRTSSPPAT